MAEVKVLWEVSPNRGTVYVDTDPRMDAARCSCEDGPDSARSRGRVCGHLLCVMAGRPGGTIPADRIPQLHSARDALSPEIKDYAERLHDLKDRKAARLEAGATGDDPELKALRRQIRELEGIILEMLDG